MFYYIVKITIYSAPLVLVILESEFDVIFKWNLCLYGNCCVVDSSKNESPLYGREFMPWKKMYRSANNIGVRGGGEGDRGATDPPPPSLVRNISYSGNLYSRVGQSSCSCFVSVIFLIFSFHLSLAPCIKTHTKTQEMALKRLYFSKFSWGACPRTPVEVLASGKFLFAPPPKISKPVRLWLTKPQMLFYHQGECFI